MDRKRERAFNPNLLNLFGARDAERLLPDVALSTDLAGGLTNVAAAATGLPAGTPVAGGAGDLPACVLGAGAVTPGVVCSVVEPGSTVVTNGYRCVRLQRRVNLSSRSLSHGLPCLAAYRT